MASADCVAHNAASKGGGSIALVERLLRSGNRKFPTWQGFRRFPDVTRSVFIAVFSVALTITPSPLPAHTDTSQALARWSRLGAVLETSAATEHGIIEALEHDVADRSDGSAGVCIELGRLLLNEPLPAAVKDDPTLGVRIFEICTKQIEPAHSRFWSEFTRAALLDRTGRPDLVAESLASALIHADVEKLDAETISMTIGFLGHAQQSAGTLNQAQAVFQQLRNDRIGRNHAVAHLGEIALDSTGIDAALAAWFDHPDGFLASVLLVTNEADKLWRRDPNLSYELVRLALARIEDRPSADADPALEDAIARLRARTLGNAIPPRSKSLDRPYTSSSDKTAAPSD